jgi:hypothetical protein
VSPAAGGAVRPAAGGAVEPGGGAVGPAAAAAADAVRPAACAALRPATGAVEAAQRHAADQEGRGSGAVWVFGGLSAGNRWNRAARGPQWRPLVVSGAGGSRAWPGCMQSPFPHLRHLRTHHCALLGAPEARSWLVLPGMLQRFAAAPLGLCGGIQVGTMWVNCRRLGLTGHGMQERQEAAS